MSTSSSPSKLQRQLDLIAHLVGRHVPVPVEELMEKIPAYAEKWVDGSETSRATARRTFERDKDELRKQGIPLQTVTYSINYGLEQVEGYRIERRDFYLPYLRLLSSGASAGASAGGTAAGRSEAGPAAGALPAAGLSPAGAHGDDVEIGEEDARVALEALRRVAELPAFPLAREARSAFRKLAFDLDPTSLEAAPVLFVERPGAEELEGRVRRLSDALLACKRVRFRYRGIYRGEVTERGVAPYGLLFQRGHWYLIGHDAVRDGVRVFRVGRIEGDVAVNTKRPGKPDYEVPADFRLDDYARREAWELGGEDEAPLRARVHFRFPASLLAERNGHGELVEERGDGSTVRAFDVAQVDPFLRWLLTHEGEAEVLDPPELAVELRRMAEAVAKAHGAERRWASAGAGASAGARDEPSVGAPGEENPSPSRTRTHSPGGVAERGGRDV